MDWQPDAADYYSCDRTTRYRAYLWRDGVRHLHGTPLQDLWPQQVEALHSWWLSQVVQPALQIQHGLTLVSNRTLNCGG